MVNSIHCSPYIHKSKSFIKKSLPGMIYPQWIHADYSQLPISFSCAQTYHPSQNLVHVFSRVWSETGQPAVAWAVLCFLNTAATFLQWQRYPWPLKEDQKWPCFGISQLSQQFRHSPSGSMDLYESSFLHQSLSHPLMVILPFHESQALRPERPYWWRLRQRWHFVSQVCLCPLSLITQPIH